MIDIESLNKAVALTQSGHFKEAKEIYSDLLNSEPENPTLLSFVGLFYINIGNFEHAGELLRKACEISETFGTVSALGFCEFEQKKYENAIPILEHALEIGESADVYNKLILSYFHTKKYLKAIELSEKMYNLYPQNPNSITNMVKSYTQCGKLFEAEKICVEYLKEHYETPSLWFHLGFLKELIYSNDKQACECYKIALNLGHKEAYYNIAVSYQKQGDYKQAVKYYNKMLEAFPNDTNTTMSLGMCQLSQKNFKDGYRNFFVRETPISKKTDNPWNIGQKFEKNVVVLCDQGFGDHIQFIRYLPFLKEKTEKIFVATHKSLVELFKKNYPEIEFISYEEIDPKMQSIRVTDLAYALNMDFEHIPFSEGYLKADTQNIQSSKLKVGLCWEAGSAGIRTMINRTINIKLLEPLLNLENAQIYSFQVDDTLGGNEKYPQMINLAKDFKNFEDTAKALNAMDMVVSVDTSIAHLAGALSIKTLLLLPYITDWRWFDNTKTTPWYKSIEIFKQTDPISWEKPINDIIDRIKNYEK